MTASPGTRAHRSQRGLTLVELLVAMTVMGILTTMIIGSWFALQSSASSASQQDIQRDNARQALSRIATEVRDAQSRLGYAPIQTARANVVTINTTFNDAGNTDQDQAPHLVRFLYDPTTSTVYRTEDTDGDGTLADETAAVLLTDVVNGEVTDEDGSPIPLFSYSYYTDGGDLQTDTDPASHGISTARVITVRIRLLVDVKPNKSPTFMDLSTAVQPRNLRN